MRWAPPVDPRTFWNAKILGWENSRYAAAAEPALFERIAGRASASLRFRVQAALSLLAPHLPGRPVVEIGCGSGLLADRLIGLGAASYTGYDIADTAIQRARQRYHGSDEEAKIRFHRAAVAELPALGNALIVSLGLFDWLSAAEIGHVFAIGGDGAYLHTLSERRGDWQQLVHRLYVHFSYGRRTGSYVPRYHRLPEIVTMAKRHGAAPTHIHRDVRLSFGMFIGRLPPQQACSPWTGDVG